MSPPPAPHATPYLEPVVAVLAQSSTHRFNLGQGFVTTTRDKVKIALMENAQALRAQHEWMAPLGVMISVLTTLVAADFKKALGLEKEAWQALFLFTGIYFAFRLVVAVVNLVRFRKVAQVDFLIAAICVDAETGGGVEAAPESKPHAGVGT